MKNTTKDRLREIFDLLGVFCIIFGIVFFASFTILNKDLPKPDEKIYTGSSYNNPGGYADISIEDHYKSFYSDSEIKLYVDDMKKQNKKKSAAIAGTIALIPCILIKRKLY